MTQHIDVGLKLGRGSLRCVFLDQDGRVLLRREAPAYNEQGPDAVMGRMVKMVEEMAAETGVAVADLNAIGVGVPGPLNSKAGMIYAPPRMNGWDRVPLGPRLSVLMRRTVYIENDSKASGWGEFLYGAGKGCRNMVSIILGSGVGGAVILDGKLYSGKDGAAGEIGHIPLSFNGRLCSCGNRGCVEAYVSPGAIVSRFRKKTAQGWKSSLVGRGEEVTSADIFAAAAAGDPLSLNIVEKTGRYLGALAVIITNFVNPERIIVGGSTMHFGSVMLEQMRQESRKGFFGPHITVDILPSALGMDAGAIGVAKLAVMRMEEDRLKGIA